MLTSKTTAPKRRHPLSRFGLGLIATLPIALAAFAVPRPAAAATATTLYNFAGGTRDGCGGANALIFDSAGTLHGETFSGGASDDGTVFSLVPGIQRDAVQYSFNGYNKLRRTGGKSPVGGLILDSAGNGYGATVTGGSSNFGTIFKLAPDGTFTTLHHFTGGSDGAYPFAGLVIDAAGNLYGTTSEQGLTSQNGTIFKITPAGALTTLYQFTGGNDGGDPLGGLVLDKAGNLYGTTSTLFGFSGGTVFEFTTGGQLLTLHAFENPDDGVIPQVGVIFDAAGNLYGTTDFGGQSGNGTVFELAPDGTFTVLHDFQGGSDGFKPGKLIFDSAGNLYGTTTEPDVSENSTLFRLRHNSDGKLTTFETLVSSLPGTAASFAALTLDSAGTLYGATSLGGTSNCGVVYSLAGVAAAGPALSPSQGTLSFQAGSSAATNSVTISVSGGNYIPQTPLLTGANASDFAITSTSCTGVIANGASCSIGLTYTRRALERPGQNSTATLNLTGDATLAIPLVGMPKPIRGLPL